MERVEPPNADFKSMRTLFRKSAASGSLICSLPLSRVLIYHSRGLGSYACLVAGHSFCRNRNALGFPQTMWWTLFPRGHSKTESSSFEMRKGHGSIR